MVTREPSIRGRRAAPAVVLLTLLLAGLAIGLLGEAEHAARPTDSLPAGLDSTLGTELREALPDASASSAVVLWTASSGTIDQPALREIERTAREVGAVGAPGGIISVAEDRTAAVAAVPFDTTDDVQLADLVSRLRDALRGATPPGVTALVTGPAAVQADLSAVFDGADTNLLLVTAGVVAVLLVITYRSPLLWLLPLLVVGCADRLAAVLATHAMATLDIAWDASTVGILSVLVFGAGTDYALLLIARYRDELRTHESRHAAMAVALHRTTEAIVASATTVVLGLLTLLLSLNPTTRGLGLACAVGIVVAATFALVVLPATLVLFGRWVFWPRIPHVGEPSLTDIDSFWHRVGTQVLRRPRFFILGSVVVLAGLSAGLVRIELGLDQADQFLDKPEAVAAAERLAQSFPAGLTDPTQVLTRDDGDAVRRAVAETPGVAGAEVTASGNGVSQVDAILDAAPGSPRAKATIQGLRAELADFDDTHVTGTEASAIDAATGAARDRTVILPLILGLVLLSLLLLLRSVVASLILVATVLATYAASLGASWWIFTRLLGFDALDSGVPLLAFLFLVALGVDYNIFLVTRARQEARDHGTREGMLRALTTTGGVITSAGILLAAVFLVLGVLPLVVLAQLGAIICLGVLLDTLLVRTVLVPAIAWELGERFWWPSRPAS
jgi:RND superfamily putative drug exporter